MKNHISGEEYMLVDAKAFSSSDVKTSISQLLGGHSLSFVAGDSIRISAISGGDVINQFDIGNTNDNVNHFYGYVPSVGHSATSASFFAVYPNNGVFSNTEYTSTLPSIQRGTLSNGCYFDNNANYLMSVTSGQYDENGINGLQLPFFSKMGMIKIHIVDSSNSFFEEDLESISLSSSSILSGVFSIGYDNYSDVVTFSEFGSNTVSMMFEEGVKLNPSSGLTLYLFVAPTNPDIADSKIKDATIEIQTVRHKFVFNSSNDGFLCPQGEVTVLPDFDLSSVSSTTLNSTESRLIIYWGDSFTNICSTPDYIQNAKDERNHPSHLRHQLADRLKLSNYTYYDCALSGDWSLNVGARQGGITPYTGHEMSIPFDGSSFSFNQETEGTPYGIFVHEDTWGDHTKITKIGNIGWLDRTSWLTNPCRLKDASGEYYKVNGVTCEFKITSNSICWINPQGSEPLYIPEGTEVETESSRVALDAYVQVIYVGTNGHWGNRSNTEADLRIIAGQIQEMVDRIPSYDKSGNKRYLVIGYHVLWNGPLLNTVFSEYFGDHYINLYETTKERLAWMLDYTLTPEFLKEQSYNEMCYSKSTWPTAFRLGYNPSDGHVSKEGAAVIGRLIYERMYDLGYLY